MFQSKATAYQTAEVLQEAARTIQIKEGLLGKRLDMLGDRLNNPNLSTADLHNIYSSLVGLDKETEVRLQKMVIYICLCLS